jgi:cell division protein FtsL
MTTAVRNVRRAALQEGEAGAPAVRGAGRAGVSRRSVGAAGVDARSRREVRRFLVSWALAVCAVAAAFVAHLALRFETVRLGYEVGHARREQRQLLEQKRLLALEAATLRQPARVEAVARGTLGMDQPDPARIVPMGPRPAARPSGGAR